MPITIELPPEAERRLTELAIRTGREVDFYLREMVQLGLEDVEDCYLAEEIMERVRKGEERVYSDAEIREALGLDDCVHPIEWRRTPINGENGGGIPSLETLRAKYRSKEDELRDSGKANLSVRMHRALSWTERSQKEMERNDPDAAFISHWIGFDAICSERHRNRASKEKIRKFLGKAVKEDGDASIYNLVISNESKSILTLAANAYVFKPFWNHYYKKLDSSDWADSLIRSVNQTIRHLERGERGTLNTLKILFDCLIELRNQLVHGGSTWGGYVNRDQVVDGARIMSRLLPVFLDLVMDNPNSFNADIGSPPPDMDSRRIKAEHNNYVRKLADMTTDVTNSEYREYLREAIERELEVNEDQEFAACVRDILDR